jgi:RNA recognition motif-containing protein
MHIFIEGIPQKYKEADIRAVFEAHGKVSDVKMIISNITRLNKGFAYVIMPEETEAQAAIDAIDGTEIGEKKVSVTKSPVTAQEGINNAMRHGSQKSGGNTKNFSNKGGGISKGYSGGGPKATIPKGGSSRGK